MEQKMIQLNNGYKIGISIGVDEDYPKEIRIETYDADEVWNQELVRISNYIKNDNDSGHTYDEERFSISVYEEEEEEEESEPIQFIINLHHDPIIDEETIEEEEEEEEEESEQTDNFKSLSYGDTGEKVKVIQQRLKELGYFNGNIGGNYLIQTQTAIEEFQKNNGLQIDGECDKITYNKLFDEKITQKEIKNVESSSTEPAHGTAKAMDWWTSNIQKIFAKGVIATITDVETGLTWKEQRKGGTNHADVQPCTAADTATLKKAYGGKWSWNRRAIFVTINGVNYAASMNGMPHGGSSIKNNNFDGHHCIHFTNSRTHCSNKVCPQHQKAIKKAAAACLE